MEKQVRFYVMGLRTREVKEETLPEYMPSSFQATLKELIEKYGAEYDDLYGVYRLPMSKYVAFKREAKKKLGNNVKIYPTRIKALQDKA